MRFLNFLAAPANAPFTIAAGVALLFALLSMSGVLGWLAGGGDSHDADHDVDTDHDADADAGDDAGDHDADADQDAEHDGDSESRGAGTEGRGGFGISNALLRGVGVGRIPVSLVWQTYAVVFGFTGLALNSHWAEAVPPVVSLTWTVPSAMTVGYVATAGLARLLGPVLSSKASEATSRRDLVGCLGVVISSEVTPSFGEVRIKDKTGHDLRVVVRLASGSAPALEKSNVVVVDYDQDTECLFVAPLDELSSLSQSESKSARYLRGIP